MIINQYFTNLKSSISSFEYHLESIKRPFKNSFCFFIASMILIGTIMGINTSLTKLPNLKNNFFVTLDELNKHFDSGLEITWADGQMELNKDHTIVYWPYVLDFKNLNLPSTFALISNSQTPPSESTLVTDANSLLYLNQNSFYISDASKNSEDREWIEYPLNTIVPEKKSFSINKQNLPRIIEETKTTTNQLFSKIQVIATIVTSVWFVISKIWLIITESVLIYFLFKIYVLTGTKSFNLSYKKIIKLSMSIMVPAEIISLLANTFYNDFSLPMNTISFWVIFSFVSFQIGKPKNKKITLK